MSQGKLFTKLVALSVAISLIAGCANWSRTAKGGLLGAGIGGAIGGIIGKKSGNTAAGVIIGGAVGGAAGAAIGRYMDKQAEELRSDLKNAKIERVGEGIKITFESGILFDVNSSDLRGSAKTNIQEMAKILNKYGDTKILIQGHTDSTGSNDYNQQLSERRAASVAEYAAEKGVALNRMSVEGYGEEMPVADNGTTAGRQANRRGEIAIMADEKLKEAAEKGDIKVK